ncbi:hypothetical protein ACTFIW_000481 [Dictyostelium discoideum]
MKQNLSDTINSRKVQKGIVVSNKMNKTVVVRVSRTIRHHQYEKVFVSSAKCYAHDESGTLQIGDEVGTTHLAFGELNLDTAKSTQARLRNASTEGHRHTDVMWRLSHPTKFGIPAGLQVKVEKNTLIAITGIDRQAVEKFAGSVFAIGDFVRRKAGKASKSAKK